MSGGKLFPVKVTLRDPINHADQITYTIIPDDSDLARDWQQALIEILEKQLHLEKNFCFLGFPHSRRDVNYLCTDLNRHVETINKFSATQKWEQAGLPTYWIEEFFIDSTVRYPNDPAYGQNQCAIKHSIMNKLHNHFELLQGTVWNLSEYYRIADIETRYAIRQLNLLCHELESLILSQQKLAIDPKWVRPSQITTFLHAPRYELTDAHREGFAKNRYDRVLGRVYMHWTQIGKTLYEVFKDEDAPKLNVGADPTDISIKTGATCEAINALRFYSGEFDIEWGRNVEGGKQPWHDKTQSDFRAWIEKHGLDFDNPALSLGYLKIGQVDLEESFGTVVPEEIWQQLGSHLDIYSIEVNGTVGFFDYNWSDPDHKERQIKNLKRTEHAVD